MKKIKLIAILLSMCFLVTACGTSASKSDSSAEFSTMDMDMTEGSTDSGGPNTGFNEAMGEETAEPAEEPELSATNEVSGGTSQNQTQKLIKNVYMNVETKEFDDLLTNLSDKITEIGGYIESSQINGNSYNYESSRYACLTVRIPCDKLNSFVSIVDQNANVTNKSESTEDVTLQYVDMSSHVDALRAEQKSLMKILEAATKVEDIIKIQSQLTDVRYEIESYESQLRTYDNLVSYSTVTIDINEVERETATETESFGEKISARLSRNLYEIEQGFLNFVIWFISSLPYLLIWAVIIVIIIVLIRKTGFLHRMRKGKKRNEKKSSKSGKKENQSVTEEKDEISSEKE